MRLLACCLFAAATAFALGPTAERRAPTGGASTETMFRIDAAHSTVSFEIPFMYSSVRGRFDDVRGSVRLPGATSGAAMAVIRVASINTGSAHRDEHLRSEDFFDAARYPFIVFRSDSVVHTDAGSVLTGAMSMHGVTRRVRIPCRMAFGPLRDPHSVILAEVTGVTTLARRDFGIMGGDAHNQWFDKLRSATMGDSVRVSLQVHLWASDLEHPDAVIASNLARFDSIGVDSSLARLRSAFARDSAAVSSAAYTLDGVGQVLLARGRVREGFLWLHQVARLLSHDADAMVSVGQANALLGDTTRARQWYELARSADSLNTRAYVMTHR